jgi:hypothetical protein
MAAGRWGSRAAAALAPSPARASAGSPRDTSTVIRTLWPVKEQPGHADQRELARIRPEHWGLAPAGCATCRWASATTMGSSPARRAAAGSAPERDEDTELAWTGLTEEMGKI